MTNLLQKLVKCNICPRSCNVNRKEELGYCNSGIDIKINTWQKHFGEEPVISGKQGSGTIFFSNCNLGCVYCQNYKISQLGYGRDYTIDQLSGIMLDLQGKNVHNINLVTPTHYSLQILAALKQAKNQGLKIPIVWNTGSYEKVETLKLLDGYIDIYLADLRYFCGEKSQKLSDAGDYVSIARKAVKEMHRQVSYLETKDDGIAQKGLLIRILVLPNQQNNLEEMLAWIARNLGNNTYISLMSQYYPAFKADDYNEVNRSLTREEYQKEVKLLAKYGFEKGYVQRQEITPFWTPDFKK